MTRKIVRVETVLSVPETLSTATTMHKKHVADGANSPLNAIQGIDWSSYGNSIAAASNKHQEAEEYKLKMEQAYQERDKLMEPVNNGLIQGRQLLKAAYVNNPKKLGEWGFRVHNTPKNKGKKE